MLNVAEYGWAPAESDSDSSALLKAAMAKAADDPRFGLPAWSKGIDEAEVKSRPIVLLGVSEFTYTILYCIDRTRVLGIVDDFRPNEAIFDVPCISTQQFSQLYKTNQQILCVNCARFGRGNLHFKGVALSLNAPLLNFEQFARLCMPAGLDYRLSDHLPAIVSNASRYDALEARLTDDLSKETLRRILLFHLTTCRDFYRSIERPYDTLYFRSGIFDPSPMERFVDCGASIGESISTLLEITTFLIDRAWLFEPDRINVQTLQTVKGRLARFSPDLAERIDLLPFALGKGTGTVAFRHVGGHGGNVVTQFAPTEYGDVQSVPVVALDDVVDRPTLIKMDIEGSEMEALEGAQETIAAHRPRLCISAYHRPNDLVDIAELIQSIRPDYKVGLRHHTSLRWDTCLYFY
jgi:FkbM family methyltransferase